jgi:hypothetical protein
MEENKNVEVQQETQNLEHTLTQEELYLKIERLRFEQNLPFAIIASLVSSIVMAILWAVITVATGYQIGYMAIAVGLVVGFAVRFTGKGIDKIYGIIGAAGALLGCVLGNFLSQVGFIAQYPEISLSYFEALKVLLLDIKLTVEIMKETFSPIDLLFYGIALYEGYRFSFRKIDEIR